MTTEHTVWCARARVPTPGELPFTPYPASCSFHLQVSGTARAATREARNDGWQFTTAFGWLCPTCARAYRRWKDSSRAV